MNKNKLKAKYKNESLLLTTMMRCSIRYLNNESAGASEEQGKINEELTIDIIKLYHKYEYRLDKKCRKKLGITLEDLMGDTTT